MSTDYTCQAALDRVGQSLSPLLSYLVPDGRVVNSESPSAVVLLAFLDGLNSNLTGRLAHWHAEVGERLCHDLSAPEGGFGRDRGAPPLTGWEALATVQHHARSVLTLFLAHQRPGDIPATELPAHLALVEDTLIGSLCRATVPPDAAAQCSAAAAVAAGALLGARPFTRSASSMPPAAPTPPQPPVQAPPQPSPPPAAAPTPSAAPAASSMLRPPPPPPFPFVPAQPHPHPEHAEPAQGDAARPDGEKRDPATPPAAAAASDNWSLDLPDWGTGLP